MNEVTMQAPEGHLVEQACNGCLDSFGILYRRYYGSMIALAFSVTGDICAAEDAAQETFAIACRDLPKLRSKDKFTAWLAGICRNVAKQMNRQEFHKNVHRLPSLQAQPEQNLFSDEVRRIVWQLRHRDREPIVLRYYDNLSYEQIAAVLGISVQAVHGRLIRAKLKIAKQLKRVGITEADYEGV
ncbi:MAG: sigma-70 family RNA polymerase sigma factor [Sedimentisphaerales bacterium]|nr:sigma-70 family RNA polymerase sigma factor [Sedimentisphaerales bacterium]